MYEELVTRLREESDCAGKDLWQDLMDEAADAIEELSVVCRAQKAVIDKLTQQLRAENENGEF